jgi:hypothetical protein
MHIYRHSRIFLLNLDQITHLVVVTGASIQDRVLEVHLSGKVDPIRIEDWEQAEKLIARCETLSQLP